jgi:membrane-associated phospholipid phosphatase
MKWKKEEWNAFFRYSNVSLPLVTFMIGLISDNKLLLLTLGMLLSEGINTLLKSFFALFPTTIFNRPKGAKQCGTKCSDDLLEHKLGFPSGHSQMIWFFIISLLIIYWPRYPKRTLLAFPILLLFASLITLSRIGWTGSHKCHTPIQVICGSIIGCIIALFYWKYLLIGIRL